MEDAMKIVRMWVLCILLAASSRVAAQEGSQPAAQDQTMQILSSLNWIDGPQSVDVFGKASFDLPTGYVFLNPQDTKRFMEVMQNPSHDTEYLFAPEDLRWFAVLEYDAVGYVKDDEKIDSPTLLESIRRGTEEANKQRRAKGWSTVSVVGWTFSPRYDPETKRLEWAIDGRDEQNRSVINFNTRILGRHGVTSAVLVADAPTLDGAVREFKSALRGYQYTAGERYHEFKQGDKVAAYGLSALVAGGTAAALVKTSAGKWLWKWLGIAVIAVLAGFRSLIFRNKSS
jgi:uncharacterized membrane-anchored protein